MRRSLDLRRQALPGQAAYEDHVEDELTRLTMQVTDEITWRMRSLGLSRADLASRMGVSPGRVSQVLSGGENITLRTLASLAAAVDTQFEVQLHREDSGTTGERPPMEFPAGQQHPMASPADLTVSRPQEFASVWSARGGIRPGPNGARGK
jgi:transcriptional regulator with XRE-family HTH domain